MIGQALQEILDLDPREYELKREEALQKFFSNPEAFLEKDDIEVITRNQNWLSSIAGYHNQENALVLFAVGFAHIKGLHDLLKKAGFEAIKFQDLGHKQSLQDNYTSLTWMSTFNDTIAWEKWRKQYSTKHPHSEKNGYGAGAMVLYEADLNRRLVP